MKSLRADDLEYTWPEWMPDGATWVRDSVDREPELWPVKPDWDGERWNRSGVAPTRSRALSWFMPVPNFGTRPGEQCILIKGQKSPELPPCPPGDGWVEWGGGECPVAAEADVNVQLRCEVTSDMTCSRAGRWHWKHDGGDGDIVRYRVVEPTFRPYNGEELKRLVRDKVYVERKNEKEGGIVSDWKFYESGTIRVKVNNIHGLTADTLLEGWVRVDENGVRHPCGVEL